MFNRLKQKWSVNWVGLLLIFVTFALGGSLCGYVGRRLLSYWAIEKLWLWLPLYIVLVTLFWPLCVLLVSLPLGQFSFFKKFLGRLGRRIKGVKHPEESFMRIAIFASGGGSNAARLIAYFSDTNRRITVALVVCNKPGAGVVQIATQAGIPVMLIERTRFFSSESYVTELRDAKIDFIVLAGFLWKIPDALVQAWPQKIVNIHPALLPKYGGKGMYGHFVHEAVIAAGDKESGITIHLVDEQYDHGHPIFQVTCPVLPGDTPEILAKRVLELEHRHFAEQVARVIKERSAGKK